MPGLSSEGADAAFLIVPGSQPLFSAEFKRSESDLTLIGPEAQRPHIVAAALHLYEFLEFGQNLLLVLRQITHHSRIAEKLAEVAIR